MNKIINWLFGSFFRTIGRILVYILLALVLSYVLKDVKLPKINVSNLIFMDVHAIENIDVYSAYSLSDSGMFWNVGSSGYTTKGYNLHTTSNNYQDLYYAEPNDSISLSLNGGGMAITQCGLSLLDGNYYGVSLAWSSTSSDNYLHPFYTNKAPYVLGITDVNTSSRNDINYISVSNGVERIQLPDTSFAETFSMIFKANRTGSCLTVTFSSSVSIYYEDYYFFRGLKLTNLGSQAPTAADISSALNNQFNSVNSSINNGTNSIINNQNSNAQDIINNQNANSQAEIDSQKVCKKTEYTKDNTPIGTNNNFLTPDGVLNPQSNYYVSDYIPISINDTISVTATITSQASYCLYNENKTIISCQSYINGTINKTVEQKGYLRFSVFKSATNVFKLLVLNQCKNGNQAIGDSLDDMNDYITDDTAPSSDISSLGTVQGLLPPGPVDSLLNIPFTFLSVLTSSMSGTCVPLEGTFVFNSTLSIPCFSSLIYDNNSIPAALMIFINLIPSAFILIKYFKHLYKKVDRAVSMESTADDEWGVI